MTEVSPNEIMNCINKTDNTPIKQNYSDNSPQVKLKGLTQKQMPSDNSSNKVVKAETVTIKIEE